MRFFWLYVLSTSAAVLASLDGTPTLKSRDLPPLNPPVTAIVNHHLGSRAAPPQSNAKRLAAGLPPLRPSRMWSEKKDAKPVLPRTSGSPCKPGFVRVNNGATVLGYLSANLNKFGEYANVVSQKSDSNALKVCVSRPSTVNGNSDVKALNSLISALPYLGAFKGYHSVDVTLNSTSPAYLFLGQVAQTAPGAPPAAPTTSPAHEQTSFGAATEIYEEFESNLWRVNRATGEMQLWWVNPDTNAVQVPIVSIGPDGVFAATGAPDLFADQFSRKVTPLTFYYVSN